MTQFAVADERTANAGLVTRQSSDAHCQFLEDLERECNLTHTRYQLVLKELQARALKPRNKPRLAVKPRWLVPLVRDGLLRHFDELRRACFGLAKQKFPRMRLQKWWVATIVCLAPLLLHFLLVSYHRLPSDLRYNDLRDDIRINESLELRLRIIDYESGV